MILIVIVIAAAVLLWFSADSLYESHRKTRDHRPIIFYITGINSKYIDDREKWIRQFRWQIFLVVILFLAVLLANYLR
ncbi:MAG: hypothetical protein PHU03_02700 [Syntrophales bacterium]|nr:hypothetical protein [Syntrophales bacterium]